MAIALKMSAFRGKAHITIGRRNVRVWPKADSAKKREPRAAFGWRARGRTMGGTQMKQMQCTTPAYGGQAIVGNGWYPGRRASQNFQPRRCGSAKPATAILFIAAIT